MKKIAWVTSWSKICGIADYAQTLWNELLPELKAQGIEGRIFDLDTLGSQYELAQAIEYFSPQFIHFQHEYGLFGGKNPPLYFFPNLIEELRFRLPNTFLVATAHTVISPEYRFPVSGKGLQAPVRAAANLFLLPWLRQIWNQRTWSPLDGVVVHSKLQVPQLTALGVKNVRVIPHFVKSARLLETGSEKRSPSLLVFGFFTPEKGQDVAIRALARVKDPAVTLVLAGGSRRPQDVKYQKECEKLILKLGLSSRVTVTGFVPEEEIDSHFSEADLVIVPFRATSGSGSITQAFARGAAVLASDLPLNIELGEREPGVLKFFKSESSESCAAAIDEFLSDPACQATLRKASIQYSRSFLPAKMAREHLRFYQDLEKKS